MKQIIQYTVYGSDRDELVSNAENLYRVFMADDSAVLPGNAIVNMEPDSEAVTGSGDRHIARWTAHVHVSTNTTR